MRPLLKPLNPTPTAAGFIRRFCATDPQPSPSPSPSASPVSEVLALLKSTDPTTWSTHPTLPSLLSSLTPPTILALSRNLPSYENALHLFNALKTINAPTTDAPNDSKTLSLAFQAVLEHATRVSDSANAPSKLRELFLMSKDQNVPLSVNAAGLLIKFFGEARLLEEMIAVFDSVDDELKTTDTLNLVLSVLMKWGRWDDALKVLDEMLDRDSCYPPNKNTAGIVFGSVLRWNRSGERDLTDEEIYGLALRFGEHGIFPGRFWFTQIITRFCRHGEYNKAWDVLHKLMDSEGDVDVTCFNAMLAGLGKVKDIERMNLLMREMKEMFMEPDVVTCGIMMKNLCRYRRIGEALELFEKMKNGELSVRPDVIIYNTLIDGLCKVGRETEGLTLLENMWSDHICKPNTITYNCLIDGFCKAGDTERGLELFNQMSEKGVEVNVITLNSLADGLCRHKRVSTAMKLFEDMRQKGLRGNTVTYTVLITAFCGANNIDKAMQLFDQMVEDGCSPDAVVYYSLISGLCVAGKMDYASNMVSRLKESGYSLDIVCCNILISGYCKKNRLDKATEILKVMEDTGLKPDRITYNTLISFFCNLGDFKNANKVMKNMLNDGLTPTVVTYGALIQAYCKSDNLESAMKIFKDMNSSSRVVPNTVIYNILIDNLCKRNDVEGAISLMEEMKDKGVRPNSNTYNSLLRGLRDGNMLEKALYYMDRMTEEACNPDYITMEILTEWFTVVGQTKKLQDFVKGYPVSAATA